MKQPQDDLAIAQMFEDWLNQHRDRITIQVGLFFWFLRFGFGEDVGRLQHDAIEDSHHLIGTVRHRNGFTPCACFGNAKGMLPENVRSHVVFSANHQQGENTRIRIIKVFEMN